MRRHAAHFTALHVAAETRRQMRAADHAYLTTPAERWVSGGNALDEPWWRVNQRAKVDTGLISHASARPNVLAGAASSPPITSGGVESRHAVSSRSGDARPAINPRIAGVAPGPLTHQRGAGAEKLSEWQEGRFDAVKPVLANPTHQRPGPVDCRADTPFPCGSSVAAVGAPRNATGADAPTSNGGAASLGLAASAAGAPLYALVHYCRAAGLPEPVPEYRFHPTRMWRFDYAFPLHKIAVEVDGGVWTQGRHTRGAGYIADMEKMNAAAKLGWRVLKYTPQTLGVAIDDLRVVLV